jgi:anti-sigma factor RsiW
MKPGCAMELLVQAEFDGELDADQSAMLRVHRESCPACQAALAMLTGVRNAVQSADLHEQAPEKIRNLVAERVPRPRSSAWRPVAGFALGAVAASLAFYFAPQQASIADEIANAHVRALQPGHLEDVVSTDRHTVKPWFDGKLDFAPPVKDLASQGFPLKGARIDFIDGREVAVLVYGHGAHLIDLFVWPDGHAPQAGQVQRRGFRMSAFASGEMTLWAISDMDGEELAHFIALWRAA